MVVAHNRSSPRMIWTGWQRYDFIELVSKSGLNQVFNTGNRVEES